MPDEAGPAWQPILSFQRRGTAEAVAAVLESERVPTQVIAGRLALGLDAEFALAVPRSLVHRARWILQGSEFDEAELTYLATGELSLKEGEAAVIDAADAASRFDRSTRAFSDVLDGVSERAWRLRPSGKGWSIAETVEHVVLTDRAVGARLRQVLAAPFPAGAPHLDDAAICAGMFDAAGPAPPGLAEPTGCFATCAEGISALVEVSAELIGWTRDTHADLRAVGLPHPVFGVLDGVQWVLFAAAHTDNHLPQLRALLAHHDELGTS